MRNPFTLLRKLRSSPPPEPTRRIDLANISFVEHWKLTPEGWVCYVLPTQK